MKRFVTPLSITLAFHAFLLIGIAFAPKCRKKVDWKALKPLVVRDIQPLESFSPKIEMISEKQVRGNGAKKMQVAPPKKEGKAQACRQSALAKIADKLGEIEKRQAKAAQLSKPVVKKEESLDKKEAGFELRLGEIFMSQLVLPEKGSVTLSLEFNGDGKLLSISPLEVESHVNLAYLQEILPQLSYPHAPSKEVFSCRVLFEGHDRSPTTCDRS